MSRRTEEIAQQHDRVDAIARYKALRTVCHLAIDAADAALILEILGIDPLDDGQHPDVRHDYSETIG